MQFVLTALAHVSLGLAMIVIPWHPARAQADIPLRQAFDIEVPNAPTPVSIAGKTSLVYELHLSNFAAEPLTLRRVAVLDSESDNTLAELEGAALLAAIGGPERAGYDGDHREIPSGVRAVIYISLAVDTVPRALKHRVDYSTADGARGTVDGGRVEPRAASAITLGPPLRGGPWAAVYWPEWERGHRRVLYAVGGAVRVPGRYAIDWIKLDGEGRYAHGDSSDPTNWYGYGADVLAVADATVAASADMAAEPATVRADRKVALHDAAGNFIALDLGDDRYAFYEHLQPGSVRVKPGDRVRRSQVIARVGFTGQSTGPHLHFHVADAVTPLDAEGLPYALGYFRLLGGFSSAEAFGMRPWEPVADDSEAMRDDELPAPMAVVEFPDDGG